MAVVCYYCAVVAASYQNLEFKHSFQTCSDSFSNSKNYWIPAEAKVIIEKNPPKFRRTFGSYQELKRPWTNFHQ